MIEICLNKAYFKFLTHILGQKKAIILADKFRPLKNTWNIDLKIATFRYTFAALFRPLPYMKAQSTELESKHKIVESWQLPVDGDKLYPVDTVIDAYIKGKNDGLEQTVKLMVKQFNNNMNRAAEDTGKVISFMREKKFNPLSAHLRVESFDNFSILITVPESDFISDSFKDIYVFTDNLQKYAAEDLYNLSFSFIDKSESFDNEILISDGYIFTHEAK